MGSSIQKDEKLDIYMQVDNNFYVAGNMVQGCIYIDARQTRKYDKLLLHLKGEQRAMWIEVEYAHLNTHQNYDSLFTIHDFQGQVKTGQYKFPFSFLLPSTMSGSFTYDHDCYIKYTLSACLTHPSNQKSSQTYDLPLNIQQPLRQPPTEAHTDKSISPKCCDCLCSYGNTLLSLTLNKNFVTAGDELKITGNIDNMQGKTSVDETIISLVEKRVMVSKQFGSVENREQQEFVLDKVSCVNPANSKNFQASIQVPATLGSYTAIGRVTARYFVVKAQMRMGLCAEIPPAEVHVVLQSTNPKVSPYHKVAPPDNWNPQTYPAVQFTSLTPFIYNPMPGIPFTNQSGKTSPIMNHSETGKQLYPQP